MIGDQDDTPGDNGETGTRIGVIVLVAALHVGAVLMLIRAFAPGFSAQVTETVIAAFDVSLPQPTPTPPPPPAREKEKSGAAADAGKKAKPREDTAPKPKVEIATKTAPKVAGKGNDASSGARDQGPGTGAGGQGSGTGSGNGGDGSGGGAVSKAVKIAGDINSARDYPKATRDLRIDDHVVVAITVGVDGSVKNCRVHRASKDTEADRITCQLASQRFRFRPATNANGQAVESTYGWQQRWYYPGKK